jgi:hypothetical protein
MADNMDNCDINVRGKEKANEQNIDPVVITKRYDVD